MVDPIKCDVFNNSGSGIVVIYNITGLNGLTVQGNTLTCMTPDCMCQSMHGRGFVHWPPPSIQLKVARFFG